MPLIATANVNGIRAAQRRGMAAWLRDRAPDVLCLQEVRAPDEVLSEFFGDWHIAHTPAADRGRAGVAVLSRDPIDEIETGLADDRFSGRWVQARAGDLTVVSVYVPKGDADDPAKQQRKYDFLDLMLDRMAKLRADGSEVLVTGDFNICHREIDLKNWKGNLAHSGFLPAERAVMDRLFGELGWVDVGRTLAGESAGAYTWWSWRGKAFDNDAGWRIDYQIATPGLADRARKSTVDRAKSYSERWSDHAPLVVDYR